MSARFADLTLAEAAQRLNRYRPLVLTVVVTLGLLRVLPEDSIGAEEALEPTASAAVTAPVASPGPVAGATSDPPSAPAVGAAVPRPRLSSPGSVAPTRSPAPPTTPATPPSPPSPALPSSPQPEPVAPEVLQTGWATRAAGTPAGSLGVPDSTLPVGNRVGQIDKASFLRLGADRQSLALAVDPDGSAGIGEPTVKACAITTASWEPVAGSSFDEAPEWDPDDCVAGVTRAEGEWTFEIGGIDQRFGVALVPGPDAPVEFRVAFRLPS